MDAAVVFPKRYLLLNRGANARGGWPALTLAILLFGAASQLSAGDLPVLPQLAEGSSTGVSSPNQQVEPMQVEVVFAGLCSFLNVRNLHSDMPPPSVILVRANPLAAPGHPPAPPSAAPTGGSRPGEPSAIDVMPGMEHLPGEVPMHIAFLGYDTEKYVASFLHDPGLEMLDDTPFVFLRLDGVEIRIANSQRGLLEVDPSYDYIVRKDDYWPEAKGKWNRDLVPLPPLGTPKKGSVTAFMRLVGGRLAASRISEAEFEFPRPDGTALRGHFAEEATYQVSTFGNDVTLTLSDLSNRQDVQQIRLTPRDPAERKVTLFIANVERIGMKDTFNRTIRSIGTGGEHFFLLNKVAEPGLGDGPVAHPVTRIPPPGTAPAITAGFCGPGNANGS